MMRTNSISRQPSKLPEQRALLLQGFVICATGFSREDYLKVGKLVAVLGAQLDAGISPRVNCLVAKFMGAPLCEQAIKLGIPIVSVEYLQKSQDSTKLLQFESFLLPPLYRLTVCCTGLPVQQREQIRQAVEDLGGRFSHHLQKDATTHLIALEPSGDKYDYASSWGNVHIVTPAWIEECWKLKQWTSEAPFRLVPRRESSQQPSPLSSLPSSHGMTTQSSSQSSSTDSKERPPVMSTQLTPASPSSSSSVSAVAAPASSSSSSAPSSSVSNVGKREDMGGKKRKLSMAEAVHSINTFIAQHVDVKCLPDVSTMRPSHRRVLTGKQLFIAGYSQELRDFLVKCVLHAGGQVSMVVSQTTYAVALGPLTSDFVWRQIELHPVSIHHVNVIWFLETFFAEESWLPLLSAW